MTGSDSSVARPAGLGADSSCDLAETGAAAARDGAERAADGEATVAFGETAAGIFDETTAGAAVTATGTGVSFAPHIPQKRFSSEFSLPQRRQRTIPPCAPHV